MQALQASVYESNLGLGTPNIICRFYWGMQCHARAAPPYKLWVNMRLKKLTSSMDVSTLMVCGNSELFLYLLRVWLLQKTGQFRNSHSQASCEKLKSAQRRPRKGMQKLKTTHLVFFKLVSLCMQAGNVNIWTSTQKLNEIQWLEVKDRQIMTRNETFLNSEDN